MNKKVFEIYNILLDSYGPQGWWPLISKQDEKCFNTNGYHPNIDYSPCKKEIFEISIGAVLTQNSAWRNVTIAISNLINYIGILTPQNILDLTDTHLADLIKPSGYYNQKSKKLKKLAEYFLILNDDIPSRDDLLSIWGIGPETADCIMLYGFSQSFFVIDKYTTRLFSRLSFFNENIKYEKAASFFTDNLPDDTLLFQEYHALIVEHGKRHCKSKPDCCGCILLNWCNFGIDKKLTS